jgi:hypothetical protein
LLVLARLRNEETSAQVEGRDQRREGMMMNPRVKKKSKKAERKKRKQDGRT